MARERIQQLVSPNDDDELMGNYLFDRFMARITNKELSYILHISALFLISMYKVYLHPSLNCCNNELRNFVPQIIKQFYWHTQKQRKNNHLYPPKTTIFSQNTRSYTMVRKAISQATLFLQRLQELCSLNKDAHDSSK